MRIGTWNLAGRLGGAGHLRLLQDADCDVWLLTEVDERLELPGASPFGTLPTARAGVCRIMERLRPILLTVPLLCLAACGAIPHTPGDILSAGSLTATGDWLTSDNSSVTVLRLLDSKGALTGSIDDVEAATSASGAPVDTTSLSVTGTHEGAALTLTVNAGLGITQTWSGSVGDSRLSVRVPQKDGSIQTATFQRADDARYESAVKDLKNHVTQMRQAQAQAQQEKQAAASQAAASRALTAARSDLSDDMNSVNQSLSGLSVQSEVSSAMVAAQAGYQSETDAYNAARSLAGPSASCQQLGDALSKVNDAATSLADELATVSSSVADVDGAVGQVQSAVGSARQAVQQLQAAGETPDSSVDAAIADADARASAASEAANAASAQGQDMSNNSDQILNEADKLSEDCNQNG